MRISKKNIRDCLLILVVILLSLPNDFFSGLWWWAIYSLITAGFLFVIRDFQRHGALGIVLLVGGLILYTFPYLGFYLNSEPMPPIYYSLYLAVIFILLKFNPVVFQSTGIDDKKRWFWLMNAALLVSFSGLFIWSPIYQGFYALALLFLDRCCRSGKIELIDLVFHALPFYLLLLYYYVYIWSGYGRLHFLVYLMLPVLVLFFNRQLSLKAWHFCVIAPFGLVFGYLVRSANRLDGQVTMSDAVGGSVSHNLVLMDDISQISGLRDFRFIDLFDQFVLYFLNWFPRDAWVEKPVGIGLWFVDEYLGRQGHSEGHNVSLGLWGEHIYLWPDFWLLSGFLSVLLTGFVFNFLYRISYNSSVVVLVFQSQLLTLFWGGMASFGSRVWWMVLPLLLYLWFEKLTCKFLSR